jgi:peptidoglycan/xylan/chitin deacetylase (PgdA/CDA1 family)
MATDAAAVSVTKVSLTFDNNTISQYNLAYQQALQPHNAHATFFVNSGTVGSSASFMSWTQLGTLASAGNDIGGKSVNSQNLITDPNPTAQVCNDRAAILNHGLTSVGFAYPGGSNNATVQGIVKGCGYGNARTAGGLSATGSTWAETLPPANWFATRAYAPGTVSLANMQSLVNGAASHGGGWDQIVITKVCSQTLDPNNYTTCSGASGHIELADLNAFLDWMANAGQSGGAPAGATLSTVGSVVNGIDTTAPTTTIACNGAPCSTSPYAGTVAITLAATDLGSGVAVIRYTLDGTDPTASSPAYTGAFNVNGNSSSTTVKFRSWDYAGNVEATNTQVIQAPVDSTPPTTTIACNGSQCSASYIGSVTVSLSATDTGGSGVAATYYTIDGTTPTTSSSVYSGAFILSNPATYSVQFFSADNAGNAEQVQAKTIQVLPVKTAVSLTFDNGTVSQYTLGYLQALQPHGAPATFLVNSGNVGVSSAIMTWAQLKTLAGAGNDIGGKTVNATNLTTDPNPTAQVCDDRQALIQHGLNPVAFAYPGGSFNSAVEAIVKNCGYGNARTAGSLSPTGPTFAETLPPKDWFATRAYAPTGQLTLANMKSLITGAASKGGGWTQIVIGKVCSQALDPNSYSTCTTSAGWIELADLNAFLDWMANVGQSGGAPAGASLGTVAATAASADSTAPTTTISCNGAACVSATYTSTVYVTLSATDSGSAVASTHYTTDGSDPTLASPTYTTPVPITSTTTFKFRSWDNAGNAETTQTQVINASLPADSTPPVTTLACDGSPCKNSPYYGSVTLTLNATDAGGWGVDKTYYTMDGTSPSTSSPVYSGPIAVTQAATYTIRFFSVDLASNSEQIESQQVQLLPPRMVVSLTFDDGDANQYALAFQRGLKPHNMGGTFYVNSGNVESGPGFMTWSNIGEMAKNGQEIGGHTVHHIDLTSSSYTQQQKIDEVCNDRQAIISHGVIASSFAYPFGAYDANAKSIVQSCGYTSARRTGGIASSGPPYAETIPPKDPYATITWTAPTPTTSPIRLSDMEAAVTNAYANGGGWVQFVTHEVCSQTYDPADYSTCIGSFRPTELDTYNAFLDWLQAAGQPGGAPAGTTVSTVGAVINGPDLDAPVTTLQCDGVSCASSTYSGSVTLSLSANDGIGSGTRTTYFTTDGSTPTTSSPTYTLPFTIAQPETIKFFSVDNAGNTEPVKTQTVQVQPNPDPVIGAAGDIACDPIQPAYNDGQGTATDCRATHTAALLNGVDAVLPLGDDQYQCGGLAAFQQSYATSWGVKNAIAHPVPGDHDYYLSGASSGTDCSNPPGAGYFQYFGSSAGDPSKGYYSYDLGSWHVIALNSAPCGHLDTTFCAPGSAQDLWLQHELAANSSTCTLAYYQNPRFTSTAGGGDATYQQLWQDLYNGGADVVLNGDSHWYERFAPMDASGNPDPSYGIREFIVGTGGQSLDTPATPLATSQVLNNTSHGVIQMVLHAGSYDWRFLHVADRSFTDSGTANCHGTPSVPDRTPPTTSISCNGSVCSASAYASAVSITLSAIDDVGGSGVDNTYYTLDGSTPTTSSTVYTGPFSVPATTTVRFFSTDVAGNSETPKSQTVTVVLPDTAPPTTTASCDGSACGPGWHTSSVSLTLSATDTGGSGVDKTYYTLDGSTPTTSSTVYTGALTLTVTTTVRFFSTDLAGNREANQSLTVPIDQAAPTTTITCGASDIGCTQAYQTSVTVSLSASDSGGSGVSATYFTLDGSAPTTSSTLYTGPFELGATTTVRYFSVDVAGNTEGSASTTVTVNAPPRDTTAPVTTIGCNGGSCAGWFRSAVTVTLLATDTGGSGVSATYYTLNGSTPTTSSTRYTGAFTVSSTTTVKFFSTDIAGNAEVVQTAVVQIDAAAPTTTITCNNGACSAWFTAAVTARLAATDTGGSGVATTRYTVDGTNPNTSTTAIVYTGPFTVASTQTVRFASTDVAGNQESAKPQQIKVDMAAPSVAITSPADSASFVHGATISITASAADTGSGGQPASGVATVAFYIDGKLKSTDRNSPWSFSWSTKKQDAGTHVLTAVATDLAGNSTTSAPVTIRVT